MSTATKGPNTAQWTVTKYLAEVYIPQKQLSVGLADTTARLYGQIAAMLADCFGRPLRLREIDDAKLDKFEAWSLKRGCKKKVAQDRRHTIKMILRHWRPDEHPKNTGRAPLQFLEADVDGSLENIFQNHYLPERPEISSPQTVKQYGRCLRTFTEFLGHTATLRDLTDKSLGQFLRHRIGAGVNARTANGEAKQLKALWNWAAKKRLVEQFPTIGKLPEPELTPQGWSRSQLQKIIDTSRELRDEGSVTIDGEYWLAFHLVIWNTGERTGAMLSLTWSMLDAKTGHLTVPAEVRKGGRKAGRYLLKPDTLEALKAIASRRRPDEDRIFYIPRVHQRFYLLYKRLILAAGLPWVRYKTGPQKMRRSFASHIAAAGGDATAALRHSTRRTTEESYLDPAIANPLPPNALLFDL